MSATCNSPEQTLRMNAVWSGVKLARNPHTAHITANSTHWYCIKSAPTQSQPSTSTVAQCTTQTHPITTFRTHHCHCGAMKKSTLRSRCCGSVQVLGGRASPPSMDDDPMRFQSSSLSDARTSNVVGSNAGSRLERRSIVVALRRYSGFRSRLHPSNSKPKSDTDTCAGLDTSAPPRNATTLRRNREYV
eukprot:1909011-Rhodomonas_salina.1